MDWLIKPQMKFKMNLENVKLNLIDEDPLFRFSDEEPAKIEMLKRSIETVGILKPLILLPVAKKYKIVDGFKRFVVARESGICHLPAWIVIEKTSMPRLLSLSILANYRNFSISEKARIIRILRNLGLTSLQILEKFGNLIGISAEQFDSYLKISYYPDFLLSYISRNNLSLKQALSFDGLCDSEQKALFKIVSSLNFKGFDVYNILTDLKEIAIKEKTRVGRLIEELELSSLAQKKEFTRSEKIEKIKSRIKERKYPLLTKINAELVKLKGKLKPGKGIEVNWDERLETSGLKLIITISHPQILEEISRFLSRQETRKILSVMLRVYHEGLPNKKNTD